MDTFVGTSVDTFEGRFVGTFMGSPEGPQRRHTGESQIKYLKTPWTAGVLGKCPSPSVFHNEQREIPRATCR